MGKPFRAAVVGCGGRGRLYAQLAARTPGIEVVAFADARLEAATAAAAEFGAEYATAEVERVWADASLDAVFICTWHDTHTPFALAAAAAGKHILMEKPLALTVAECETITAAARATGVVLMTAFKLHCCPLVQLVRARLGEPWLLTGQMMDSPWPATHWATRPGTGGGNVLSQGCHTADLMRYLAGADPVRVHGEGGTMTGAHPDVIDNVVATVAYANGAVGSLVQGDLGANSHVSKFFYQVWGRNGAHAMLDQRLHRALIWSGGGQPEEITAAGLGLTDPWEVEGDAGLVRGFVAAVTGAGPASPDGLDATWATRTILAIFESIATGQAVEFNQ